MAFEDGEGRLKLWFARVQKILSKRGKGRKLILSAVDLDNVPAGLQVKVHFYSPVPRKRRTYKYRSAGRVSLELESYPVTAILYIVHFDYNATRDEYTLQLDEWRGVQDRLKELRQRS